MYAVSTFSKKTLRKLSRKGIEIIGTTIIPNNSSDLPSAFGDTGYAINDNGTYRILTFSMILELAS